MKAIFRLPFDEKFILIHHHEAARNVASFFPFTNGKAIHLQAENLEICSSEELKSSFFEVENFPEINAGANLQKNRSKSMYTANSSHQETLYLEHFP